MGICGGAPEGLCLCRINFISGQESSNRFWAEFDCFRRGKRRSVARESVSVQQWKSIINATPKRADLIRRAHDTSTRLQPHPVRASSSTLLVASMVCALPEDAPPTPQTPRSAHANRAIFQMFPTTTTASPNPCIHRQHSALIRPCHLHTHVYLYGANTRPPPH